MDWLQRRYRPPWGSALGLSVLLVVLVALFYRGIALEGGILPGYDLFTYFYPYRDAANSALLSLRLPLWNPYVFMGVPFLANVQAAVLYPLNWLWLWLDAPAATTASILLHVSLAGLFMLAFLRWGLGLRPLASFFGGLAFALGGFLSAQVGHPNQVAATAWLPAILLLYELALRRRSLRLASVGAVAVALQFLAGHPQEFFMSMVTLALFVAMRAFIASQRGFSLEGSEGNPSLGWAPVKRLSQAAWASGIALWMVGWGLGLAGIQLLPTLELSGRSFRAGGLSYGAASSFSLPPQELLRGLLPTFGVPPFSEYTGYLGIIPLTVAFAVGFHWRPRSAAFLSGLVLLALLLALGGYTPFFPYLYEWAPGFASFRVPARWLLVYSFSGAALAAVGLHRLASGIVPSACRLVLAAESLLASAILLGIAWPVVLGREVVWPEATVLIAFGVVFAVTMALLALLRWRVNLRWVPVVLVAGAVAELFVAGSRLDLSYTVPPEAYDSVRPVLAELVSLPGPHRVLSVAEADFDPGDSRDLPQAYNGRLNRRELEDLVVTHKYKDLLAPNLGLTWGLASIDGYDGGLLPLRTYAEFQPLLLPEDEDALHFRTATWAHPDALLRDLYAALPDAELMGALGTKYVLSNKMHDAWVDGVYYDLAASYALYPGDVLQLEGLPVLEANSMGFVSYVDGLARNPDGESVVQVEVYTAEGLLSQYTLRLGWDTAEGGYGSSLGPVAHTRPRVVDDKRPVTAGSSYYTLLRWPRAAAATHIRLRSVAPGGRFVLRALTLIDGRTQVQMPVNVDPSYEMVYSGDLKVYRDRLYRPRGFIVHRYQVEPDLTAARAILRRDMLRTAVLDREPDAEVADLLKRSGSGDQGGDGVELLTAEPERVVYRARLSAPGLLVATDTYYPGWEAYVDGERVPLLQADIMFRAVALRQGAHRVEFVYRPLSVRLGAVISVLSLLALAAASLLGPLWRRASRAKGGAAL